MANIYWNIVDDILGVSANDRILILSYGKDYLSDSFPKTKLDALAVDIYEEMECIYTWDEVDEKRLRYELSVTNGFVESPELVLERDDDEEITIETGEVVEEEEETSEACESEPSVVASKVYECEVCESQYTEEELATFEYNEEEGGYVCPECEEIIKTEKIAVKEASTETSEESVEEEATSEEVEEASEEEATTTVSAPTPAPAPVPVAPVSRTTIKDWKDLDTVEKMFSFLKNYISLTGIDAPILSRTDGIPTKVLFEKLADYGVTTKEYINDTLAGTYDLAARIGSGKKAAPLSFDSVGDAVIMANGCSSVVFAKVDTVYLSNVAKYDNLYLFWLSILGASEVAYAKAMMKNAMAVCTKKIKSTKELFEFDDVEIPSDIKNLKLFKIGGTTSKGASIGDTSEIDVWEVVTLKDSKGYRKYITSHGFFTALPSESMDYLRVRGVRPILGKSQIPVPNTVATEEDVEKLLSGIPGLLSHRQMAGVNAGDLSVLPESHPIIGQYQVSDYEGEMRIFINNLNDEILSYLRARGIDTLVYPFQIPDTIYCEEDIDKLLAGIPGLVNSKETSAGGIFGEEPEGWTSNYSEYDVCDSEDEEDECSECEECECEEEYEEEEEYRDCEEDDDEGGEEEEEASPTI